MIPPPRAGWWVAVHQRVAPSRMDRSAALVWRESIRTAATRAATAVGGSPLRGSSPRASAGAAGGHNYSGRMQPTASMVVGAVEAGPLYPLTMPDRPNTRPVHSAVVEALHDGNVVAATTTDDAGRYELRVHPGTYLIRARAEGLYSKEPGRTMTVSPAETLSVPLFSTRESGAVATSPPRARCVPDANGHPQYEQSPARWPARSACH